METDVFIMTIIVIIVNIMVMTVNILIVNILMIVNSRNRPLSSWWGVLSSPTHVSP